MKTHYRIIPRLIAAFLLAVVLIEMVPSGAAAIGLDNSPTSATSLPESAEAELMAIKTLTAIYAFLTFCGFLITVWEIILTCYYTWRRSMISGCEDKRAYPIKRYYARQIIIHSLIGIVTFVFFIMICFQLRAIVVRSFHIAL